MWYDNNEGMHTKRILLVALSVIMWLSVSGCNNQAPVATNPPTIQSSQPEYSPPTSNYGDYSPAWSYSNSDVDVRGYYRKDGTYVKPYSRTKPDGIKSNNYSYPGNYNPNTGKISK
jgi:hypothetical protein